MTPGVFGKPYIDLTSFLDIESLDTLHPEICRGFVLSKSSNLSYRGNLFLDEEDQAQVNLNIYNDTIKPVWYQYQEYTKLPEEHPIKISAKGLSHNELALYLKYTLNAYDPYQVFPLFTQQDLEPREMSTIAHLFPSVINWIDNITIFKQITKAYFLLLEHDGISIEHCDPYDEPGVLREFVHIRSKSDRPFYVKNSKDSEKIHVNARACYFNDQDWHGGDAVRLSSYTLRIDGKFTDEFKKKIQNA